MIDGRLARGERARTAALDAAIVLATESGLDGLSFSQLAERLGVSKSGLFAHWRTKEELQLAAIEHAQDRYTRVVVLPALKEPRGLRRLWAMHERRLADVASGALPGGCFFCNAQFEFVARPGPVHDRLAEALQLWHVLLQRLINEAVELGELGPETDPEQLSFELNAHETAAIYESRLLPASRIYTFARTAALVRLRGLSPTPELLPEA
ncbi:TetR/AcrR family transcriptional regulator [Dactylosporangium salmoneum]|uniref:TetR/AcrR family transcriptional regulator n=1 Tax=Dactylosporangium salmoneum TaxID=53361 RepID=A0ABN3GGM7_9ACTN